jgi:hypothetical protein
MATNPQGGVNTAGLSLPEKVIEHLTLSAQAMQKAAQMEKSAAVKQAQVDKLIPQVVETMLKHERINPDQQVKLAEMLKDPAQTLELLIKVAGHRNKDELARLGDPMNKTASANGRPAHNPANSLTSPHVGARTTMVKQSDHSLFRGLGLSIPTN